MSNKQNDEILEGLQDGTIDPNSEQGELLTGQAKAKLDIDRENLTEKEIMSNYFRNLQKKSSLKRLQNDPNTYKKMRALQEDRKEDLTIKVE